MHLPKFIVWKARGRISLAFVIELDIPPCSYGGNNSDFIQKCPVRISAGTSDISTESFFFVFFILSRINMKVPTTILSHYRTQCATNCTVFSSFRHPYSGFFTFEELYCPKCTVDSGLSCTFFWISIRNWVIAVVLRKIQSFTLQTHYNYQLFATHGFPSGPF